MGIITFSSTVSVGSSWKNWKTMPMLRARQRVSLRSLVVETSTPSTTTMPDVGRSMPVSMFRNVDLPPPEGPTRAMNSPRPISMSMPWSTPRGPAGVW